MVVAAGRERVFPRVGRIKAPSADMVKRQRRSITIPDSWWGRLDALAEHHSRPDAPVDRDLAMVQIVCGSLDDGGDPPTPPADALEGGGETASVYLTARRWAQMEEEKRRRGLSLNKIFQAHYYRGLLAEEAELTGRKPSKR